MINLVSPKIALGFVRTEINKQVGVKVKKFEIRYDKNKNQMSFLVYHPEDERTIDATYEDDKLVKILELQINQKAKDPESLDGFVIEYNKEGSCYLTIYEKINGKKEINRHAI